MREESRQKTWNEQQWGGKRSEPVISDIDLCSISQEIFENFAVAPFCGNAHQTIFRSVFHQITDDIGIASSIFHDIRQYSPVRHFCPVRDQQFRHFQRTDMRNYRQNIFVPDSFLQINFSMLEKIYIAAVLQPESGLFDIPSHDGPAQSSRCRFYIDRRRRRRLRSWTKSPLEK